MEVQVAESCPRLQMVSTNIVDVRDDAILVDKRFLLFSVHPVSVADL